MINITYQPIFCHNDNDAHVKLHTKHQQNELPDALLNHSSRRCPMAAFSAILIFHSSWPIQPIVSPMYAESIVTQCPFPWVHRGKYPTVLQFFAWWQYCCTSHTNSCQMLHHMCGHGVCSRQGCPSICTASGLSHPSELALALAQLLLHFCTIRQHGFHQRSTTFQNRRTPSTSGILRPQHC